MGTEFYAELTITSQTLAPEQIGSRTGLEAEKVWRKGEQRLRYRGGSVLEKANSWAVRSQLSRESTLEEHVADLLGRLAPHVDKIRALLGEYAVAFVCGIYAASEGDYAQQVILSGEQVDLISVMAPTSGPTCTS